MFDFGHLLTINQSNLAYFPKCFLAELRLQLFNFIEQSELPYF